MLKSKKIFISILIIFLFCAFFYFFNRKYIIENAENMQSPQDINSMNEKIVEINKKNKDKYPGIKLLPRKKSILYKGDNFNDLYRKLVNKYKKEVDNYKKNNILVKNLKIRNKSISFDKKVKVIEAIRYFNENIADLGIKAYS